jgi:DNA helicase-2/ATP-dependent DNA helicase PcrA
MARTFHLKARRLGSDIDFRAELNDEQFAVATASGGPMLVVAGAGSGKTRALTYRLAWLVAQGVDPGRIMLVTFTNRAAREMLQRVALLVRTDIQQLWGGTFHHIANRILREHAPRLGLRADFSILDREDACDLIGLCVAELGIKTTERRFPQKRVLAAISSFIGNTRAGLDDVVAARYPMFARQLEQIGAVLRRYADVKRERNVVDYDDLLIGWLALLREHADVQTRLSQQFQHLLVDEYQDTNAIQGEICDALARTHGNICVVGDDAQSIYSFRGATVENILRFKQQYPQAREYRLETNYRSTPEILALANTSIGHNTRRLPKNLQAVRPSGLKPAKVTCPDHFVQARFLAEYVLQLLDEGRRLNDIAVLYRSHWHALEIQLEFRKHNIPYQIRGGLRFFEQAHIKDVLAFLRVLHNPRDELAWLRLLPLLPRVGAQTARRFWRHIAAAGDPFAAALEPQAAEQCAPAVRPFLAEITKLLRVLQALKDPAQMLETVLAEFYGDYLVTHYDGAALRREDILGLSSFASQYATLEAFLSDVSLTGDFEGETCVTGPDEQEFIVLSTVHQAKGLEWPVVLIPWLADGRFPTDLAINTPEEEEEERRVFHVAVTRAKDELYLVVPQVYRRPGRMIMLMKTSRFITEIDAELYEPMILQGTAPQVTTGTASEEE